MTNPYFNLLKILWKNGIPWRKAIVGYYLAYIVAQACMSLSPYAFGRAIDALQQYTPGHLRPVVFWMLLGVVLVPLFWVFHGPARVVERKVALKIQQSFVLEMYEKLTQLPLKWHQEHHSGKIITQINRASQSLKRFAEEQFIYIETLIRFLVSIAFLCWISPVVGLVSFLCCVVAATTVVLFDRKLIRLYHAENEVENYVGAGLFDYVSNMTTVLTLRFAKLTKHNLFQRFMAIWPFFKKENVLNEVKWFTMGMLLSVAQSAILLGYVVYHLETMNTILIGTVVMIFRYQWDLSDVFFSLSQYYSELARMDTDVASVRPILDDIKQFAKETPGTAIARKWQTLSLQDLRFSYPGNRTGSVVYSMSFTIKRGEKIALIGTSGGGKSTLLNLLSGLYEPEHVTLTIDESTFDSLESMHAITTLIPQEPEIFENTIAFNITMDLKAEPDVIDEVMALSCFAPVLKTLPEGLATDIREKGLNFSVGQKQRLALARGLFAARFSSLILMDEPTSSVDLATEKKILSAVIKRYTEAAMIVSLHRLHLLPQFDRIIMLDNGAVVADGLAAELLVNPGPVRELWQKYQISGE